MVVMVVVVMVLMSKVTMMKDDTNSDYIHLYFILLIDIRIGNWHIK